MREAPPLQLHQRFIKRSFDLLVAGALLVCTSWIIVIGAALATLVTRRFGIFTQTRVGTNGETFKLYKIRTMRGRAGRSTTVTTRSDDRITRLGAILRRYKLDELPQLVNVVRGDMSLVGPRPDVVGFADKLEGHERAILAVRPGITGPATLAFRNEEQLLASVEDPEQYNRDVIYPAKVEINLRYLRDYSLRADLKYLMQTIVGTGTASNGELSWPIQS